MRLKNINPHLKLVDWPVQNVRAFTTTIQHPFLPSLPLSNSPYGNFNLGFHVGDDHENVSANRNDLLNLFPKNTNIQWLEQVHGNDVLLVEEPKHDLIGDALVTRTPNLALSIMTADCLPILLSTLDGAVVAAIHVGWKPLVKGIIENTLNKMNVAAESVYAWLGPCIGQESFEVGAEVQEAFCRLSPEHASAFISLNRESSHSHRKYLASLHTIANQQLNQLGVTRIHCLTDCTYINSSTYYSYRRQGVTGRMATLISRI